MTAYLRTNNFDQPDITPRYFVKAERNTKGWSIEASVSNDADAYHALAQLSQLTIELERVYPRELTQKEK